MTEQTTNPAPIELGPEAVRQRTVAAAIHAETAKLRPVDHNGNPIPEENK